MILPDKYTKIEDSMIYQSSLILTKILKNKKMTLDTLWKKYHKLCHDYSYIYFICLIEFMYISNMINYNDRSEIFNENIELED